MKRILYISTIMLLCNCSSQRQLPQVVERVHRDTLYRTNLQYDSIYVYQDKYVDRSRDTIRIRDSILEYRYKIMRDTVYKTRVDSIPYEVRITEVKEVPRSLTRFDKFCRSITIAIAMALLAYLAYKARYLFLQVLKLFR